MLKNNHLGQAGFTLIELLISIAIIMVITGMTLPIYESFVRRNDLDLITQTLAMAIRRAETYARAANYDSAWGIEIQSSSITLFQGGSFASRNTAYDETVSIPGSVTPSGLNDIQFAKLSGLPNITGTIILTSTTNDTRTVTLNAKGVVSY